MRKLLQILCIVYFASTAFAAEVSLNVTVSRPKIYLGESVNLNVEVRGADANLTPPGFAALPCYGDARPSAWNTFFRANVGRCPTLLIAGRCPADAQMKRLRCVGRCPAVVQMKRLHCVGRSPTSNSVGQRPTYGCHNAIKAVSLAHFRACLCARLTALITLFRANVGRCPTLVCTRPLALGLHDVQTR